MRAFGVYPETFKDICQDWTRTGVSRSRHGNMERVVWIPFGGKQRYPERKWCVLVEVRQDKVGRICPEGWTCSEPRNRENDRPNELRHQLDL